MTAPRNTPSGSEPAPEQGARGPVREELTDAAVVSRSWGMAFATLISRITGFIRIVLLAAILGAALASSFTVANQLPNLVAALVLEATFTAIFVPVLARAERDDPDQGTAFVRRLVTLATTLLLVTTIVSVACAPLLVRMMLGSDPQVNEPLTTAFAYLLLPQVLFYGLSSVFMAILNNRNIFGPPAWAPVLNNVVAIVTLALYVAVPGELSLDPVRMGDAKLLVLGIGTTLGVVAQAAVLFIAIRREHISLRPLWGIDERLKRFGAMAAAMVLYVLISQIGLVVGNQIASTAAASGPAIYNYTWLVLMLPFGMIGVTVLTVVMPRLSRNAAAENTPGVLADLSLATRLTMITLIPIVALMTVGGPAMGSALFAYGKFGQVDANYLGISIALSAFTLIPYALVLLQLRVFYAREQPWRPIVVIVVITIVKIIASLLAPHMTDNPDLVAGYLGLANGLGFAAGAVVGHLLLRRTLAPADGRLLDRSAVRTVWITVAASVVAALLTTGVDRLLGLARLTDHWGGVGSLIRLMVLTLVLLPVVAVILVVCRVPEAQAARAAVLRRLPGRLRRGNPVAATGSPMTDIGSGNTGVQYPEHNIRPGTDARQTRPSPGKGGAAVTDDPLGSPPAEATEKFTRPTEDAAASSETTVAGDTDGEATNDAGAQLIAGASVADGRYRLLVFHGGPPHLQCWQALDTALDRQVALTFIGPDGELSDSDLEEILSRTGRLSRVDTVGVARILDITDTDTGGLVVSEWIRGGSLQEVAETSPSPVGGARAVQSLAGAVEAAHQAGVAMSLDHPSRLRVSVEGDVVLAFPATLPDATPEDDIRGTGAALYALLVNRWALPESGTPSGMAPADTDSSGQPVEPRSVDRTIPFQISAAAARSVQDGGGIRTAPTLLNLLQQATAVADRTALIEPIDPDADPPRDPDEETQEKRRRAMLIGGGVAAAVILVAFIVLASVLNRIFGDVGGGLDRDQLGLNPPTATTTAQQAEDESTGPLVKPVRATVFSPEGGADEPGRAGDAIDGDEDTAWPTDTYSDSVPFPNFKNGVGLMLELPEPTRVGAVTVDLTSTGTSVQIRSADSANPSTLEDTEALTEPTRMQRGENTIKVDAEEPTSYLLVWISTLGTINGESRTEISEITVSKAGD